MKFVKYMSEDIESVDWDALEKRLQAYMRSKKVKIESKRIVRGVPDFRTNDFVAQTGPAAPFFRSMSLVTMGGEVKGNEISLPIYLRYDIPGYGPKMSCVIHATWDTVTRAWAWSLPTGGGKI
jgi:hypothetical protein